MIIDTINGMIPEAMKAKDSVRLNSLKEIKTALIKEKTSGKPYTDDVETKVLVKMVKQYTDAIVEFKENNANDLADQYSAELAIIKEFAPKEVSEDDIINKINEVVDSLKSNGETLTMKHMKVIMDNVKSVYPTADGALISKIFRTKL